MRRILLAALLAAGCGGADDGGNPPGTGEDPIVPGPPDPDAGPGPAAPDAGTPMTQDCSGVQAELGTGAREYEPVKDGDSVWLFKGPQGGYMVYLGIRAKGLDRSLVYVDYEERMKDTGLLFGYGQWKVQLTNDVGDGWFERVGIWGEIEPEYWTRPSFVRGKTIVMKVKLSDAHGCSIDGLGWTVYVYPDPPK